MNIVPARGSPTGYYDPNTCISAGPRRVTTNLEKLHPTVTELTYGPVNYIPLVPVKLLKTALVSRSGSPYFRRGGRQPAKFITKMSSHCLSTRTISKPSSDLIVNRQSDTRYCCRFRFRRGRHPPRSGLFFRENHWSKRATRQGKLKEQGEIKRMRAEERIRLNVCDGNILGGRLRTEDNF